MLYLTTFNMKCSPKVLKKKLNLEKWILYSTGCKVESLSFFLIPSLFDKGTFKLL